MKASLVIVAAAFVLALCPVSRADVIWSNGFESGTFSAWTSAGGNWATSGGSTHSGSKRAQIFGPCGTGGDILFLSKPSSGYKDLSLDYWYEIHASLENTDYVYVEWTANGTGWQVPATYTNVAASSDWQEASFSLPQDADNNPLFQLRLLAILNGGVTSDCVYFDDFVLSGTPIPEPTSMMTLIPLFCSIVVCGFGRRRKPREPSRDFFIV